MSVLALKQKTLIEQELNIKINVGQSTYITTQLLITINTTNCINYMTYISDYIFQPIHRLLQAVSTHKNQNYTQDLRSSGILRSV
jgi:hypothetical protein